MPLLTLEGFEVPVVPGTRVNDEAFGDYARAYSSQMRSDRRASNRVIPVSGSIFDTSDDAVALRAILNTPGKVLAGGTMIGDEAYFHVRSVQITPVTVDRSQFQFELHESGDSPSPLLFSFDGDAPGSYTFTRSGTVGPRTNTSGILSGTAANVLRREHLWLDGTYALATLPDTAACIIESSAGGANLVSSDNFDTGWTSSGTPVITSAISDPAGGTAAYRIADDSGAAEEFKFLAVTFVGNAQKALVFVVREATMPASGNQNIRLTDTTAGVNRAEIDITAWTSGAPMLSAVAGTVVGKRYLGNGYWACYALSTSVTAANNHEIRISPARTAAQTGSIDVYRVNTYNSAVHLWSILAANETPGTEAFYVSHTARPQACTLYADFIEGETAPWGADYRVLQVGSAGGGDARLMLRRDTTGSGDLYIVEYVNAAGTSRSSSVDINPAWGNRIRLRGVLNSDGSVQVGAMKDTGSGFGAETVGSASSALALPASWGDARIYLSHVSLMGSQVFISAKMARGAQTMAYMTDLARGRLHPRTADHGSLYGMSASVSATSAAVATEAP